MRPFAKANRTKSFKACSGFFTSTKLPQVFITPMTKKRTSRAKPIACKAPWIEETTVQIAPPLNSCGDCVMIRQISLNLSFQTPRALLRFCTTQLLLSIALTSLRNRNALKRNYLWSCLHHKKKPPQPRWSGCLFCLMRR